MCRDPRLSCGAQQAAGVPEPAQERASIAPHLLPRASEHRHLTAVAASGQHPEPEDPLAPFLATPTTQRAPQEATASVVCLLQRKNTLLAKVSRHLLKALVAAARALPQGILARLLGASSGCPSIPANRRSDGQPVLPSLSHQLLRLCGAPCLVTWL